MQARQDPRDASQRIDEAFRYLIDEYGYVLKERSREGYGCYATYEHAAAGRRVHLGYDYKENFFYFSLVRGVDTPYPNDIDQENVKPFFALFTKREHGLSLAALQPDETQYQEALELNAALLKKHGDGVLKGEEWI